MVGQCCAFLSGSFWGIMLYFLVGKFNPFCQGVNDRILFTVRVGMKPDLIHLPDDLVHIMGFGRKVLGALEPVTVLPVEDMLSHCHLLFQV